MRQIRLRCYRFLLLAAAGLGPLAGCGGPSVRFEDHSRDPERYAARIHLLVGTSLPIARRGSLADAEDAVEGVVAELRRFPGKPVGQYEDLYAQLLEKGESLLQHVRSGDRPRMHALIDEMGQLVAALPGSGNVEITED